MNSYKRVLTIAGSDSGGGAGIQADIKTISALGCYASSAITAVTVQNTVGVFGVHPIPPTIVAAQILAVVNDIGVDAIKIGMLGDAQTVTTVADTLETLLKQGQIRNIVLDPVLVATSGDQLSSDQAAQTIIERLFPIADLITPNIPEAETLSAQPYSPETAHQIIEKLHQLGARAVLLKGGHAPINGIITDILSTAKGRRIFDDRFYDTPNKHGTGCTLSSAIASYLALGCDMETAVEQATAYIHHAIAAAVGIKLGQGHGPVMHFYKYWQ